MNPEGKIRRRDRKISSQNRKKKNVTTATLKKVFFFQSKKKLYIGLTQCPTGLDQIVHGQTGFLAQLDQKLLGLNHYPPKTVWVGLHPWAPNQLTVLTEVPRSLCNHFTPPPWNLLSTEIHHPPSPDPCRSSPNSGLEPDLRRLHLTKHKPNSALKSQEPQGATTENQTEDPTPISNRKHHQASSQVTVKLRMKIEANTQKKPSHSLTEEIGEEDWNRRC